MDLAPLIIVSGPSGSGKSTLIDRLLADTAWPLRLSVSVTTRQPRPGEQDGVDYHFWDQAKFDAELRAGGFLEHADVFGHCYGTLEREVTPFRRQGTGVMLEIDVQGREQVRRQFPEALSIFVRTSTLEILAQRLKKRGTESAAALERRLQGAKSELARAADYDHQVINDDLEQALAALKAIVGPLFERQTHAG